MTQITTDPLIQDAQDAIDAEQDVKDMPEGLPFGERMKRFAKLENLRRDLSDALGRVKAQAEQMKVPLLEDMTLHGMQSCRVDNLTVFSVMKLTVNKNSNESGATQEKVCAVLRELNYGDLIGEEFKSGKVKSLIKEMLDNQQEIPQQLKDLFYIDNRKVLATQK